MALVLTCVSGGEATCECQPVELPSVPSPLGGLDPGRQGLGSCRRMLGGPVEVPARVDVVVLTPSVWLRMRIHV